MFRNKWLRMVLVLTILASLVATPLLVSAQEDFGFTGLTDGATISGVVTVTGVTPTDGYERWELLVFPGGNDSAASTIYVTGGDTLGEFSYDLDTTIFPDGDHVLALRVVKADGFNYTDYRANVTIANAGAAPVEEVATPVEEEAAPVEEEAAPAEETAPAEEAVAAPAAGEPGFTGLTDGATISGVVTVTGVTPTDGYERWELLVFPGGNDSAASTIYVTGGDTLGEFSYDLDTTIFPDGDHVLALRVVKADGFNYTDYRANVTIANAGAAPVEEVATPVEEEAAPVEEEAAPAEETAPAEEAVAAPAAGEPGFTGLTDGATISGVVTVTGVTPTDGYERWELLVFPGGNDSAASTIYVTGGDTLGEFSYDLDTTIFPDGDHVLALRVVKADGFNYTDYRANVTIANTPAE